MAALAGVLAAAAVGVLAWPLTAPSPGEAPPGLRTRWRPLRRARRSRSP